MPADPELTKVANQVATLTFVTWLKYFIPAAIIVIIVGLLRRNAGEKINRFFWRRSRTDKKCPLDGGVLMKRRGKYGPFLGCSNYPTCKYTEGGIKEE